MATCINDQFVKSGCYCLNEQTVGQFTNIFVGDHTLGVHSDSDEQLILHLAFVQTFKLTGLTLGVLGDGSCPATVKLFINQQSLGFSDASDTVPTQQLVVKGGEDGAATVMKVDLQAAKWQRADSSEWERVVG
jgi:hypothetical protein